MNQREVRELSKPLVCQSLMHCSCTYHTQASRHIICTLRQYRVRVGKRKRCCLRFPRASSCTACGTQRPSTTTARLQRRASQTRRR